MQPAHGSELARAVPGDGAVAPATPAFDRHLARVDATVHPLLRVRNLKVTYEAPDALEVRALRGVSFELRPGEAVGLFGESGSGKTSILLALLALLPTARVEGEVELAGERLPILDSAAMGPLRGRRLALAFQGAANGFNPVYPVGQQVMEPLLEHLRLPRAAARERALHTAQSVGLRPELLDRYPHELSGGEKQRAMLAMALVCRPEVLLLDEPSSGLDASGRAELRGLLRALRAEQGLAMLLVSHDLQDVREVADRALVLYAGEVVEEGTADELLRAPSHPYTAGLVGAYPGMDRARDLWPIRGEPPDAARLPPGCAFHPRCTQAIERCRRETPPLETVGGSGRRVACHLGGLQTLLDVRGVSRSFSTRGSRVVAVRHASLQVREGEVVALVGRTGSGKSTLARVVVGLLEPETGSVLLAGDDLLALRRRSRLEARRRVQLIFQDPRDALSPRLTALELVREPLDIHPTLPEPERDERSRQALAAVGLPVTAAFLRLYPHELSGGQLQRLAIARALVLEPKLLVADEPVSLLDASEQARIIRLLKEIQNARGMGLLLISHDLAVVRKVADRVAVMEAGEIVELGPADRVVNAPAHPATRALLRAAGRPREDRSPNGEVEHG